ncbi:hypothetical protein SAMN05444166_7341 [Singulisphaera sp. GP187]|uniref:hypothetical protein n=1 Tax=Singulisphaera sp. GP187 TaxID=1882752 RepID=UPI0009263FA9|nr:hypothetical protein [Singulisphaera sp. GP187]SIO63420.1 hypothetical protein SAMN05444166_7341 [Singulisphaera sp. GP187]
MRALLPPHVAVAIEEWARHKDLLVEAFVGHLVEQAFYDMVTLEVENKGCRHHDLNPALIMEALNNRLPEKMADGFGQ